MVAVGEDRVEQSAGWKLAFVAGSEDGKSSLSAPMDRTMR